jgi:deoxyribonuclease (pyrimidine dimer)
MRCNLIFPWFLTDQHLIAEKRELRMIPPLLQKRIDSGKHTTLDIPRRFTLGKGHMLFWLDKMLYLSKRYDALTEEMGRRGFNADPSLTFDMKCAILSSMDNDWEPQPEDYDIIVTRLRDRVREKPGWYRYCGKPVDEKWIEITYPIPYYT